VANALFSKGKEGLLSGAIDADTAVLKVSLVRGYSASVATHQFVSDVTGAGGTLVATATLTGVSVASGVLDAADVVFSAVAAGAACAHLVIYQASAVTGGADVAASAQRLIALIDTAAGLPVTPSGADINVAWDNSANKIFAL
jgi:hypothetical protein